MRPWHAAAAARARARARTHAHGRTPHPHPRRTTLPRKTVAFKGTGLDQIKPGQASWRRRPPRGPGPRAAPRPPRAAAGGAAPGARPARRVWGFVHSLLRPFIKPRPPPRGPRPQRRLCKTRAAPPAPARAQLRASNTARLCNRLDVSGCGGTAALQRANSGSGSCRTPCERAGARRGSCRAPGRVVYCLPGRGPSPPHIRGWSSPGEGPACRAAVALGTWAGAAATRCAQADAAVAQAVCCAPADTSSERR